MVVTFKFNENAENVDHDPNAVQGGKIHFKKLAKSVGKVANAVRKNEIVQDSASAGVASAVLASSDNPLLAVAAGAATKSAMNGGKLKKYSLDNDIHEEIQNHMKGGKLTLKKMLNHPVTKKIYQTASPIIKEAVKQHLQEMMNPAEKPESVSSAHVGLGPTVGGGFVKPKRTNPRGQQISILMKKHKITLGAASKMLKEMNEK
jgi:uncharacterized membrane protein